MIKQPLCLSAATTGLIVIDIQEKFRPAIPTFDRIVRNAAILVQGFTLLDIPIFVTEQYPRGLGNTVETIRQSCVSWRPVEKTTFSCMRSDEFRKTLVASKKMQLVVCGIESHVCVEQTVCDLLDENYFVYCATDAMGSRKEHDHCTALRKMELAGALPTTVEMCLFECLKQAGSESFKKVQALFK